MRFPVLSTWIATCMILLSTVVMHHHHYRRVCIALEMCSHDLPLDIEGEAEAAHSHQETDSGSCRLHQLHSFITSSGTQKSIRRHILDGRTLCCAAMSAGMLMPPCCALTVVRWQHAAQPLPAHWLHNVQRRGPPVF